MKDSNIDHYRENARNDYGLKTYNYSQPLEESKEVAKREKLAWLDQSLERKRFRSDALNKYGYQANVLDDLLPIVALTSESSEKEILPQTNWELSIFSVVLGVFWRMFFITAIAGICLGGIYSIIILSASGRIDNFLAIFGLGALFGWVEGVIVGGIVSLLISFFAWRDSLDKYNIKSFAGHVIIVIICVCGILGILGISVWYLVTIPMVIAAIVMLIIGWWVSNWFEQQLLETMYK